MENKQVTIQLISTITQQNVTDKVTQKHTGTYHVVNDSHYIRFNDDTTGKNTLKIDSNIFTCLWEKHAIKRVVFCKDERSILVYHLPQGTLTFDVDTTELRVDYGADGTIQCVNLRYTLLQDDAVFGEYHLQYNLTF